MLYHTIYRTKKKRMSQAFSVPTASVEVAKSSLLSGYVSVCYLYQYCNIAHTKLDVKWILRPKKEATIGYSLYLGKLYFITNFDCNIFQLVEGMDSAEYVI